METLITEQNIYEYHIDTLATDDSKYIVWYTKSGQPKMYVLNKVFSKSQAENADFIKLLILKREEG